LEGKGGIREKGRKTAVFIYIFIAFLILVIGCNKKNDNISIAKEGDNIITLENNLISISFSRENGIICSLIDKEKDIEFVAFQDYSNPFNLEWHDKLECSFESFSYRKDSSFDAGVGYILEWKVNEDILVRGKIQVPSNSDEIHFYSEVENNTNEEILSLEYPMISNLGNITPNGEKDYLAHSYASGFLIKNPLRSFDSPGKGLRYAPYPEGMHGSPMQFFTYYGEGRGGLYFACHDGDFHRKWLNFFKNGNSLLLASFMHGNEDIQPKKGMSVAYPVIVKLLKEGSWYEAADIYKEWATRQVWCQKGELSKLDNTDKAERLLEDTGLVTFGINAPYDRSLWIKKYSEAIDTEIFHILGPDWAFSGQNYYNHIPGGYSDWFPAFFHKNNINAIRDQNDKFAPFELDLIINKNGADAAKVRESLQKFPTVFRTYDGGRFNFLCPVAPFTQDLHVRRDERLAKDYDIDAMYYDISANNTIHICLDSSHGHTAGAGSELTKAYRRIYADTKKAMNTASPAGMSFPKKWLIM